MLNNWILYHLKLTKILKLFLNHPTYCQQNKNNNEVNSVRQNDQSLNQREKIGFYGKCSVCLPSILFCK